MHVPSCNIIYTANLTKSRVIPKSPYMRFKYIELMIKIPYIKNDGMFGLLVENALLAEINLILKT